MSAARSHHAPSREPEPPPEKEVIGERSSSFDALMTAEEKSALSS